MYRNTQSGALQDIDKNKFLLRSINRQAVTEYPLEHLTYQEVLLLLLRAEEFCEGIDYSVNYQLGRVQILDPALQASNTINVSLENNSIFGQQKQTVYGCECGT
jgi:cell surface protein SprA